MQQLTFTRVRIGYDETHISDIPFAVAQEFARDADPGIAHLKQQLGGKRIAVGVGSRGIANIDVIVNRPFEGGNLTDALEGRPLPRWAGELGCKSWAQILLKFIISHSAISCPIPATTRVDHVQENMAAASLPLPDKTMRMRILEAVSDL